MLNIHLTLTHSHKHTHIHKLHTFICVGYDKEYKTKTAKLSRKTQATRQLSQLSRLFLLNWVKIAIQSIGRLTKYTIDRIQL